MTFVARMGRRARACGGFDPDYLIGPVHSARLGRVSMTACGRQVGDGVTHTGLPIIKRGWTEVDTCVPTCKQCLRRWQP